MQGLAYSKLCVNANRPRCDGQEHTFWDCIACVQSLVLPRIVMQL